MSDFNAREVLSRYKQGVQIFKAQRKRETEALRFMVPEFQWTEQAKASRNGTTTGSGAAVPARPCLSISKIEQPIQLVQNQFQNAHLGVNIHPLSEKANKETAEILQGLYRKIERDSNATLPRGWAFDRAVEAGTGVYRIVTEYDPDSDNDFDQRIMIKRVLRQDAVIWDPSAQEPDFSDAEWAFVTAYMPMDRFKREFPDAQISKASNAELTEIMNEEPDWITFDGEEKAVLVSEYFCKHYDVEEVSAKGPDGKSITRKKPKVRLIWSKVAAGTKDDLQELESQEWNGQYIPLVPVIGKEMQVFDKDRRYVGIVEPAMDSQRMFNYAVTTAVEIAALEPKAPFVGAEGQFEGHEEKWNQANVRNWPYLEYKPKTLDGNPIPPPQRMPIDASRLSVSLQLMDKADDSIQATTYTPDPALGKLNSRDRSGKAIQALQGQAEASTSNFMQNMAQISMTYEAKVILDMIPRVYDRPGRLAKILDFEDETQEVILNAPFTMDPNTSRPVPVPAQPAGLSPMTTSGVAPMLPQPGMMSPGHDQPMPQAPAPKTYDLKEGRYGVSVSIGKSYATRLEAGQSQLGELIQTDPALAPILMPILLKFSDFPGAQEAAEVMKKVRAKQYPELEKGEQGQETPEQLRSMLEAKSQQLQQAEQIMQQMKQAIDMDAEKQKAALQKVQMETEAKAQAQSVDAQTKAQIEQMQGQLDIALERIKAEHEAALQAQEQAFEMQKLAMEQHFEALQKQMDREHEQEMAEHAAAQAEANADREDMRSEVESERDGAKEGKEE